MQAQINQTVLNMLWSWKTQGYQADMGIIINLLRKASERTEDETNYKVSVHYISPEANALLEENLDAMKNPSGEIKRTPYGKFFDKYFSHEHIVPCCVLAREIYEGDFSSISDLHSYLQKRSIRACITKGERERLDANYKNTMPGHGNSADTFARYRENNINLIQFKYRERFTKQQRRL